jgi:uncharacterized protein YbjT (DUF2867 family)
MIVITTPTGQIGRQVLGNILDGAAGDAGPIRVVARDPSRLPAGVAGRVEMVTGSLTDAGVLTKAFTGADSVFWLVPPDPRADSVHDHLMGFTRPLCDAITARAVRRLVYVTGLDSGLAGSGDPDLAGTAMDRLIEGTGVSFRALRMPAFMDNLLAQIEPIKQQGMFCYPISGDRKLPTIATRDIGAVAAGLLADDAWSGQRSVPLLGPEDLSYHEMAQIMSQVLHRPVRYQQVPAEAFTASLTQRGMSQASAQSLTGLLVQVDQGSYNAEPRTPQSSTPTTFRQWCEQVLKPAAQA